MSTQERWFLEPYDPEFDDAPKGDDDVCAGETDSAGDDDGAP
jgi:hypothetical protein